MIFLLSMIYWQLDDEFILSIQHHVDAMLMLEHLNDLMTFIILDLSTITSNVGCIINVYYFTPEKRQMCFDSVVIFWRLTHCQVHTKRSDYHLFRRFNRRRCWLAVLVLKILISHVEFLEINARVELLCS